MNKSNISILAYKALTVLNIPLRIIKNIVMKVAIYKYGNENIPPKLLDWYLGDIDKGRLVVSLFVEGTLTAAAELLNLKIANLKLFKAYCQHIEYHMMIDDEMFGMVNDLVKETDIYSMRKKALLYTIKAEGVFPCVLQYRLDNNPEFKEDYEKFLLGDSKTVMKYMLQSMDKNKGLFEIE